MKRMAFSSTDITTAIGVDIVAGRWQENFSGVSIDSRTIQAGELFVAIRGERFDGHDFVGPAFRRGARGAVVERWPLKESERAADGAIWRASDTVEAFGKLARFHRRRFDLPLIAVTGSSGKTSTKEILAHLLSRNHPVLATSGTQNNRIGVPLTLLKLREEHTVAVVEMGTNRWGEIRQLAEIAEPTIGVITNIGPSHLETFLDLRGVLREKGGLWEAMAPGSPLVLNGEDPLLLEAGRRLPHRVIWFSATGSVRQGIVADATGSADLSKGKSPSQESLQANDVVIEPWGSGCLINDRWKVRIPLPGRHNLMNALAALSVVQAMGEDLASAVTALKDVPPVPGRLTLKEMEGCFILDDSYNANPVSLQAALDVFQKVHCLSRRIGVIGDMLELGAQAELFHEEAGRRIAASGIDFLMAVGPLAKSLLNTAQESGFSCEKSRWFSTAEEAGEFLSGFLRPGDAILVKGSRGMHMEKVLVCSTTSSLH